MSIVNIAPAVVGFARPDCACAGGGGGVCIPTSSLIINPESDATGLTDADTVSATYHLDSGSSFVVTFAGAATKIGLLISMVAAINVDAELHGFESGLIDRGYGSTARFSTLLFRTGIHGGDGSVSAAPADLVLSLTPAADHDAVAILFESSITVHSCGPQVWPGL